MLTILDFLTNTDLLPTFFPLNTTCYFFFKGKRLAHTILSIKQNHSRLGRFWNDIWLPKPILVIKILINIFDLTLKWHCVRYDGFLITKNLYLVNQASLLPKSRPNDLQWNGYGFYHRPEIIWLRCAEKLRRRKHNKKLPQATFQIKSTLGLSKQPCLRLHPLPSKETPSLFEYLSCLEVLICLHAIEYCIESRTLEYRNLCFPDQCVYFVIVPDKYYNAFHLFQGKPVFQYFCIS